MTVNENFRIGNQFDFIYSSEIDLVLLLMLLMISMWCGERSAYFQILHLHSSGYNDQAISLKLGIDFKYIAGITRKRA